MPVTNVKSGWIEGKLQFEQVTSDGAVNFGIDDTGLDVMFRGATAGAYMLWDESADQLIFAGGASTALSQPLTFTSTASYGVDGTGVDAIFYGDTASYKAWWDQNGDTNGAWYFGADTFGVMVKIYGDTTGCGVFWDPTTDTNGTLTIGGSGGSKGNDVLIYGATNGGYLQWDQSANELLGFGAAFMQIGESTTGVNSATPSAKIYGYYYGKTTAVTGTGYGLRGNAVIHVASTGGTGIGVFGRAANGKSTTDTDGVSVGILRGGMFIVAGVGQAGPAIISQAQGVFVQMDINSANLTVSDARGIYVNVQSGNASANTLTLCNLAYFEYESVVGTAPAINSAIRIATVGGATGATSLIDATSFKLAITDTDKICLMKFTDSLGANISMLYDSGTPALSFA